MKYFTHTISAQNFYTLSQVSQSHSQHMVSPAVFVLFMTFIITNTKIDRSHLNLNSKCSSHIVGTKMLIISVMGQGLNTDGSPKAELVDRVEVGVRKMLELNADYIIPTGGDPAGAGVTEAGVMAEIINNMGIRQVNT